MKIGYETNTGRLKIVADPENQSTIYSYYVDNNLKQVTYSNAIVATSNLLFTYDTNYNRLVSMADGIGTNTYSYYPIAAGQFGAGRLSSVSNSFTSSTITYNYDALGRITNRAIDGVSQQIAFDSLNRVVLVTNALGRFTNTYVGPTRLLATNFYPNGQQTVFSYLSVTNDERLEEIWNQTTNGVTLSKFDYSYDAVGNITNWTQQADSGTPTMAVMQYDPVNELLNSTTFSNTVAGTILKQYAYGYDLSGNRTSEQIGTTTNAPVAVSQSGYNNVNQVTNRTTSSGPVVFAGSISRQGTVTVAGNAATMNHFTTNFVGYATLSTGSNTVPLVATDYGNHSRTNRYQLVVTNNGAAETLSYDLNGNLTIVVSATSTNSYQWDAANRLVSITGPTNQSLFTYDGLGRRLQIIEKTNGIAYATNKFMWEGVQLVEQRDLTGTNVTKRFFGEGEQIAGTSYYFTWDHLGSGREMTDGSGAIRFRGDYDPYGRMKQLQGDLTPDFSYAGMYVHLPSGLNLTYYRQYNADLGRWLSRDPMAESAGLNLYAYVANNPINRFDPLGLEGNPVSSTLPGMGGAWNSNPYGPGGPGYGPGYLYQQPLSLQQPCSGQNSALAPAPLAAGLSPKQFWLIWPILKGLGGNPDVEPPLPEELPPVTPIIQPAETVAAGEAAGEGVAAGSGPLLEGAAAEVGGEETIEIIIIVIVGSPVGM